MVWGIWISFRNTIGVVYIVSIYLYLRIIKVKYIILKFIIFEYSTRSKAEKRFLMRSS
jgi:hypothetical protein